MSSYSFSYRLHKKYVIWWRFAENGVFSKNILIVLKEVWSSTKWSSKWGLLLMHLSLVINTRGILTLLWNDYDVPVLITSILNINFIRNKFGDLDKIVDGNIDILCRAETKLDESFPNNQFLYQYNQSIYTGYYRKQRWLDGIC